MKNLAKSIQKRYLPFIIALLCTVIAMFFIVKRNVDLQENCISVINKANKQLVLSHDITKTMFLLDADLSTPLKIKNLNALKNVTKELEKTHNYLINNAKSSNDKIYSLLKESELHLKKVTSFSRNILVNPEPLSVKENMSDVVETETLYTSIMDAVVVEYLNESNSILKNLIYTITFLVLFVLLIATGGYYFVIGPSFKLLFEKNEELSFSSNKLKTSLDELSKVKINLEKKEAHNKIFIEQAPTSIAMLDQNMCYIAVSKKWISDFKMGDEDVIGRCHYELFPEIGEEWKTIHKKCLNGAIDVCDEAPFIRKDGSVQWIFWDVRPWYVSEEIIGGLIMHTGDITQIKENEEERLHIEKILEKTNAIARIGTWDIDFSKGTIFWSKVVREIHEAPENFVPDLKTAINFFKEGDSRDAIEKAVNEALENGTPYDLEVELVTLKGNILWTRATGQTEIVDGKCVRIFGVFQDIDKIKKSNLALDIAHKQLKAILNSGPIGIISTSKDGLINHINYGAEQMLGYSASELVGLYGVEKLHPKEEIKRFFVDLAEKFGLETEEFDFYSEIAKNEFSDTREWTFIRKDGSTFPVQLTITAIKDENGKQIGLLGVSLDISERKKAKEDLLRKNHLLNFAEEITMMGHWQWDTVLDKVIWSDNLYKMFELDKGTVDLKFNSYFNFVHPDDKELVTEYFQKSTNDKRFYSFTHRIITTTGKVKTVRLLGKVFTDNNDDVVEMIGTGQDITHLKMAENKFKGLLESAPDAMVIINEKGIMQLINKEAESLFGYSSIELLESSAEILFPKRLTPYFNRYLNVYYGNSKIKAVGIEKESYGINKNGDEFPVNITLNSIETEDGLLVSAAIRDITLQKRAKNELLKKNQLLNFAERITKMGNWQWDLKSDTLIWSSNLYRIFDIEESTALTFNTYFNFVHEEDIDEVTANIKQSLKGELFKEIVHRIVLKDGTEKVIRLLAVANSTIEDEITEMIGSCQDITEVKAAENELFDAYAQLEAIFNSGSMAIVSIDNDGIINHFNHGAEVLLGYSSSEMVGLQFPEVYHLEDELLAFKEDIAKRYGKDTSNFSPYLELAKNNVSDTREWTFRRKDGSTFPVELTLTAINNKDGDKIGFLAVASDISNRKKAQDELLRKNEILNFAEEITLMGNFQTHLINKTTQWSSNLYNIFEIEKNTNITFNKFIKYIHPEDRERVIEHMNNTVNNKRFDGIVHRIQLANGTIKTVQLLGQVVIDNNGVVTEVIGTYQDVTAQKMAENKFRGLLESAPDAMVIVNEAGKIQLINKQAEKLFGYSSLELLEKSAGKLIPKRFYEDYKAYLDNYYGSPVYSAVGVERELFGVDKDGREIPIQISLSPLHTEEGLLVSAAIRDITIQKIAEYELLGKNQLLSFAEQITMMGNWQWDLTTNRVKWSTSLYKIFDVDESEDLTIDTYLGFIHPEDKCLVDEKIQESLNGKLFNKVIHRIVLKNGIIKTVQLLAVITTTNGGDVTEMIGTCQDITQQQMDELKIIQANEKLEILTQRLTGQNKQLAEFAHISSHNLRSPVSNLNALLHLYHTSNNDGDKKEVFEKFEIVIEHLTSTLNTLIEALKTKKQDEKKLEKLNFEDVLNKTKEIISEKIINAKAIITSDFSEISQIDYHKTYLESIFLNLLTNAIKYRSSERLPEIHIKTESLEGKIILTFRDNGLGIDLKKHGLKLFGLNKTFHRHPEAKGVGLYLTKIQVNSMGDKIFAKSKVGKGSIFTVIFNLNTYGKSL
ncbi:hypothetical protein ULMS_10650 [Patiriisocius marinistellae]|uniref:histidine kinase n=1 Tax=Patiriisocius marinistellae TaxID=2494560 RepID=A0A5J4FT40_9FLAO|nr:PAS domain S-box protein [Patiriisocius marinistellae]GEQ85557.1 hypothetical protein ULMS_10650 [Patiriisocius marinistellae]